MAEEDEYISKITIELQPKSRRSYRRLFGIRENKSFNKDLFDMNNFTERFLQQYNQKVLQRGQHIECEKMIIAVKQIKRASGIYPGNTEVEYRLKGLPLKNEENKGRLNQSFLPDGLTKTSVNVPMEEVYSCYCSECQKCLVDGDFYVKSGNWSKPILCLSCYETFFTQKCVRCKKSITFDQNCLTSDGLGSICFVEHDGLYWHSDCCVCVICSEPLIRRTFYQDQIFNQLYCLHHIPDQYL